MTAKRQVSMTLAAFSLAGLVCGCNINVPTLIDGDAGPCTQTALALLQACHLNVGEGFWVATGNCANVSEAERDECAADANSEQQDAHLECDAQFEARKDICAVLGEDAYDPVINPADFVEEITNPYLPLTPGKTFVYQGGDEEITVVVTHDTIEILGVNCTVVRDTVRLNGEVIEDTEDWFAQDKDGNVWYFGEISQEFEDGELISLEGSWKAGVDNAKPGIIMKADPQVGELYRQEFFIGEAEDVSEVLSLTDSADVTAASCDGTCLVTKDFLPLDPGHIEHKFYAPDIGLILEVNPETGERVELVSIETE